jgi:hypothetical protein
VDVAAARALLGVDASTTADELRTAYRARLREAHPDLHGTDAGTAEVVDAYRVLRQLPPEPPVPAALTEAVAVVVEGDTVTADLPAGDLFALLVEAAEHLGHIAYVDARIGLLEVVVDVPGHGACSVLWTLQGRATGVTEAWCTVEPLGGGPAPPTEVVTELLAEGLRHVTNR